MIFLKTSAVDDVHRSTELAPDSEKAEGKAIIADIAKLKYELQHDRQLRQVFSILPFTCFCTEICGSRVSIIRLAFIHLDSTRPSCSKANTDLVLSSTMVMQM